MFRFALKLLGCLCVVALSFFVSLSVMQYFDVPSNAGHSQASCPKGQEFPLSPPFTMKLSEYAYKVSIPGTANLGDTETDLQRSRTVMCEGDHKIGPSHAPHAEIAAKGLGRFSHYEDF